VRVLLTGFEPWGTLRRNPSGEVAAALGGHLLPVDYAGSARRLRGLIRRERPDAIVMLGLAPRSRTLALEALAVNVDHCEEAPFRRWRRRIAPGPLLLPTRLPVDRLHRRLKKARVPVRLSHHAGTFICNHVFYLALASTRVPCGFVHVPPFKAMALERQVRAVRLIVEEVARPAATRSARPRG